MNTDKHVALPPLPEPEGWRITDGEGGFNYSDESPAEFNRAWAGRYGRAHEPLFTDKQMRAYAALVRADALEDAASWIEEQRAEIPAHGWEFAAAIRAL
jgi:hypothetical protein